MAVGDEFAVAPAAGQELQAVLIPLEHHGAAGRSEAMCAPVVPDRRRVPQPRDLDEGINVWIAQSCAPHVPRVTRRLWNSAWSRPG
jgi:hypothetical protein